MDGHDALRQAIKSVFLLKEPRLKLYARRRIAQHRWQHRRATVLPGGLDCDDIVYSSYLHVLQNLKKDDIINNSRNISPEDEIYRKLKRRIDTQTSNIARSKETASTFSFDPTIDNHNTNILPFDYNNSTPSPEDNMILSDFITHVVLNSRSKLLLKLASISIEDNTTSARDQAKELDLPISEIYEARRRLKKLLEEYLECKKKIVLRANRGENDDKI